MVHLEASGNCTGSGGGGSCGSTNDDGGGVDQHALTGEQRRQGKAINLSIVQLAFFVALAGFVMVVVVLVASSPIASACESSRNYLALELRL